MDYTKFSKRYGYQLSEKTGQAVYTFRLAAMNAKQFCEELIVSPTGDRRMSVNYSDQPKRFVTMSEELYQKIILMGQRSFYYEVCANLEAAGWEPITHETTGEILWERTLGKV